MALKVYIPNDDFTKEKVYILKLFLSDYFGMEHTVHLKEGLKEVILSYEHKSLKVKDFFFSLCSREGWLKSTTLPPAPLKNWENSLFNFNSTNKTIPVIYGDPHIEIQEKSISIGIDIFGSSFFMLSRYEEVVVQERDLLNRFPAKASVAYKEGFLNRPVVNEYMEILWACIQHLWPEMKRKGRAFRTLVSCDVDTPFDLAYYSFFSTGKRMAADILKRQAPLKAAQTLKNYLSVRRTGLQEDPYFKNIYYMADFLENHNLRGAFYFICGNSAGAIDGDYNIATDKLLHKLLKYLAQRGHEIGLHGSYNTYNSEEQLFLEYKNLNQVLQELDIKIYHIGGRQHYLRWETPGTAVIYDKIGLAYDTTLTYADYSGFRCGICYEFPLYDLKNRRKLNLIERPLVAMEGSIIQKKYMGLGYGENALNYLTSLKEQCKIYNGDFTLLWHNSYLNLKKEYRLFENTVLA